MNALNVADSSGEICPCVMPFMLLCQECFMSPVWMCRADSSGEICSCVFWNETLSVAWFGCLKWWISEAYLIQCTPCSPFQIFSFLEHSNIYDGVRSTIASGSKRSTIQGDVGQISRIHRSKRNWLGRVDQAADLRLGLFATERSVANESRMYSAPAIGVSNFSAVRRQFEFPRQIVEAYCWTQSAVRGCYRSNNGNPVSMIQYLNRWLLRPFCYIYVDTAQRGFCWTCYVAIGRWNE